MGRYERWLAWRAGSAAELGALFLEPTFRWVVTGRICDARPMPPIGANLDGPEGALVALIEAGRLLARAADRLEQPPRDHEEALFILKCARELRERLHEQVKLIPGGPERISRAFTEQMSPGWRGVLSEGQDRDRKARRLGQR